MSAHPSSPPAAAKPASLRARFGTARGLARLALSYPQAAMLPRDARHPDPAAIRRLIFVCHGNICRSAFAEVAARAIGLDVASFGLSTYADGPAHPPAIAAAGQLGYDLTAHRTTRAEDFALRPGDLLLAMEIRQLTRIAADPRLSVAPRSLLGLWTAPPMPHLHDPFGLDDAYMLTCLKRIEGAVQRLKRAFPAAVVS
ncbi:arsenate reductase/protein-tyrosine-phosphatase family protein [Flavisphingomonas formosensis]|uniref:arsenate reductase/protein-tyrosine-phosphatase family protein n=1 Tax=Flavisphingomonas formosensis TaxID=861534 RepID=UPI0012F8D3BB|nr:phosphotyrosine protein phosphatase [Sphingomonas formosensis]